MENDFAIIIGINDYTPPDKYGLRTLKGPINDVDEMEKWLRDTTYGNIPDSNIKRVTSTPDPLQPLQNVIDEKFLEIEDTILTHKGGKARRLYFYFAGHGLGTLDNIVDTGLCLADWSERRRHSAISSESYKDYIRQYGYFEEIIFIADCCRNTKINIKPLHPTFSAPSPKSGAGNTRMFIAYATQYQDQAYEVEMGDSENSEKRGAFTSVLIDGLKGAAANNGIIDSNSLSGYLMNETPKLAQQWGYKQKPEIIVSNFDGIPILNIENLINESETIITFSTERTGLIIIMDGNLRVIQEHDALVKNLTLKLPKGLYLLKDNNTGEEMPFQVSPLQKNVYVSF